MESITFNEMPAILAELRSKVDILLSRESTKKPNDEEAETPIGVDEAANLLGLSLQTLYLRTSRREIPFCKKNGRLYFYRSELLAWVNSGKIKSKFEINTAVDAAIQSH